MVDILNIDPPHEFDGIQACGEWIVAEQTDTRKTTQGGLIVPEASRMVVWQAISVGEKVTSVKAGDRLLFLNPQGGQHTVDGRTFAIMTIGQVLAKLRMPDPDEAPRIVAPTATIGGMLQ